MADRDEVISQLSRELGEWIDERIPRLVDQCRGEGLAPVRGDFVLVMCMEDAADNSSALMQLNSPTPEHRIIGLMQHSLHCHAAELVERG